MVLLENIFKQYQDVLLNKLIYIAIDTEQSRDAYQHLIDNGILYYHNNNIDINKIPKADLIRLTTKNKQFSKFNKNTKIWRFDITGRIKQHKYKSNGIFAFEHHAFMVINYKFLLRQKKIERLLELSKRTKEDKVISSFMNTQILDYTNDWNLIMTVVAKIDNVEINLELPKESKGWYAYYSLETALSCADKKRTITIIISFIEYYNEQRNIK